MQEQKEVVPDKEIVALMHTLCPTMTVDGKKSDKTEAELLFIRQDAHQASEICGNENYSYYADEALYAAAELQRRRGASEAYFAQFANVNDPMLTDSEANR